MAEEFREIPNTPVTANVPTVRVPGPAVGAQVPPVADSSVIPAGTQLAVMTIEPIDLLSQDESRTYRAELARPALFHGQTVLAKGTEVLLKVSREKRPGMPDTLAFMALSVDSTTVDGKRTALTTSTVTKAVSVRDTRDRGVTELPPHTALVFFVQAESK